MFFDAPIVYLSTGAYAGASLARDEIAAALPAGNGLAMTNKRPLSQAGPEVAIRWRTKEL
jgi:hypothetical protein